jgi:hypothetical protein
MPASPGGGNPPPPKYQALKPDEFERPRFTGNEDHLWLKVYQEALAAFARRADPGVCITYAQRAADIAVLRLRERNLR